MFSQTPPGWIAVKPRSVNMEPLIEVRKTALPEAQRRRQRPWCGKAGWRRSDQDPATHHFFLCAMASAGCRWRAFIL